MTKQIRISELKVGDRLPDGLKSQYGQYVNYIVTEINTTKGGRFNIKLSRQYISPEGIANEPQVNAPYSNGALSGNSLVIIQI